MIVLPEGERVALTKEGLEVEERDFFRDPMSPEEIRELADARSLSELFAWRSPSLKKLGLAGEGFIRRPDAGVDATGTPVDSASDHSHGRKLVDRRQRQGR